MSSVNCPPAGIAPTKLPVKIAAPIGLPAASAQYILNSAPAGISSSPELPMVIDAIAYALEEVVCVNTASEELNVAGAGLRILISFCLEPV